MWEEYAKDPDNAPEWQQTYMNFVFDLEDSSGDFKSLISLYKFIFDWLLIPISPLILIPGDGSIDESEFSVVCRSHGVDDSEAREAFKKLQVVSFNYYYYYYYH